MRGVMVAVFGVGPDGLERLPFRCLGGSSQQVIEMQLNSEVKGNVIEAEDEQRGYEKPQPQRLCRYTLETG